jgi:hypothetical protein
MKRKIGLIAGVLAAFVAVATVVWLLGVEGREPIARPDRQPVGPQPTTEQCRDWLAGGAGESASAPVLDRASLDFRPRVLAAGGSLFPVGDNRYFVVSVPENIDPSAPPPIVFLFHNSVDPAEEPWLYWHGAGGTERFALVSMEFKDNNREGDPYDSDATILKNSRAVYRELSTHCPVAGAPVLYYGMSGGAITSFGLAAVDGRDGSRFFEAYIADSGGWPLRRVSSPSALAVLESEEKILRGAKFWIYCGGTDRDKCAEMKEIAKILRRRGAKIDRFFKDDIGKHGMFTPVEGRRPPSEPVRAMWNYIESFR